MVSYNDHLIKWCCLSKSYEFLKNIIHHSNINILKNIFGQFHKNELSEMCFLMAITIQWTVDKKCTKLKKLYLWILLMTACFSKRAIWLLCSNLTVATCCDTIVSVLANVAHDALKWSWNAIQPVDWFVDQALNNVLASVTLLV